MTGEPLAQPAGHYIVTGEGHPAPGWWIIDTTVEPAPIIARCDDLATAEAVAAVLNGNTDWVATLIEAKRQPF